MATVHTPTSTTFISTPIPASSSSAAALARRKPSELKFKIESIGVQPEEDDDLDMCPARTRPIWPRQLTPWWQPSHPKDKPPYSYATLIAYAILISQDGRLLLSDIYRWISETYPFYVLDNRGWQNSIRHNLSLNKKWFLKVDRRPTQANPGKGCYWTLVPGTEEMFMENITEAGGHSRKHHDIGLTAELSMGHRNNLMAKHHPSSFSSSSTATVRHPSSGATFSHTNMKILRPIDYQQSNKKSSSSSTASPSSLLSSITDKTSAATTTTTTAGPALPPSTKSCKPKSTPPPSLGPMYTTFRMTSTTIESVPPETLQGSSLKKKRHHSSESLPANKRSKLSHATLATSENKEDHLQDDSRSDCDSGVDVSNEHVDGFKKNTNTSLSGLVPTNEDLGIYNVLDHFLEHLPLPDTINEAGDTDDTALACLSYPDNPTSSINPFNLYDSASAEQLSSQLQQQQSYDSSTFPLNPADVDPILGYPCYDYYSTNGFFYDVMNNDETTPAVNMNNNDIKHQQQSLLGSESSSSNLYPTLLTSSFDPNTTATMMMMMINGGDTTSSSTVSPGIMNNYSDCTKLTYSSDCDLLDPVQQQAKGPLVIHLQGASNITSAEEMTDEFLKFEEDDGFPLDSLNSNDMYKIY